MKALSNGRFLPILLDKKKRRDGRLLGGNKRAKVEGVFSENALLIIPFHWPSLCLPWRGVSMCGKDHIRNGGGDNRGLSTDTVDGVRGADDPGMSTDTLDKDGRANNPTTGIDTINIHKKANNLDTAIDTLNTNRKVDNIDKNKAPWDIYGGDDNQETATNTPYIDKIANNSGICIDIPDIDNKDRGIDNLATNINTLDADRRAAELGIGIDTANADVDGGLDIDIGIHTSNADVDT